MERGQCENNMEKYFSRTMIGENEETVEGVTPVGLSKVSRIRKRGGDVCYREEEGQSQKNRICWSMKKGSR